MTLIKTNLPESSILNSNYKKYDYQDCFQGSLIDKENSLTPTDTCKAFLSSVPWWGKKLLALRNKMMSIFGLKVTGKLFERQELDSFKYEPGEQLGLLKVFDRTINEIILGVDDKHLNFRISLLLPDSKIDKQKTFAISTIVLFNNWLGRFYFLFIKPFHKLIVKSLLKVCIIKLERGNSNY